MKQAPTHIFLAGFAGSGKSTVGMLLARRLRRQFVDLDRTIEHMMHCTVSELLRSKGERYFRKVESHSLLRICQSLKGSAVISLGGGTLLSKANSRIVARHGITVYLKCSRKELIRRLKKSYDRPLLKQQGKVDDLDASVERLLSKRLPGYEMCNYSVTVTNLTPSEVARRIRELVG